MHLDESELQPVYGCPLEDHLRIQEREIAFVIEECATFLYREALDEQVRLCPSCNLSYYVTGINTALNLIFTHVDLIVFIDFLFFFSGTIQTCG